MLNRCIPNDSLDAILDQIPDDSVFANEGSVSTYQDAREVSVQIMEDIYDSWKVILICAGVAFVLAFGWLLLSRVFAAFMIWTTLVLGNLFSLAFTAYIW